MRISKQESQRLLKTDGEPWSPEAELVFKELESDFIEKLDKKCHDIAVQEGLQQISSKHVVESGRQIGPRNKNVTLVKRLFGTLGTALFGISLNKLYLILSAEDQVMKTSEITLSLVLFVVGFIVAFLNVKE